MTRHDKAEAEIDALITLIGAHSCDYTGSGYSYDTAQIWAKLVKKHPKINAMASRLVRNIYRKHKIKKYDY